MSVTVTGSSSGASHPTTVALTLTGASGANFPFSAMSPGGVNLATGEIIVVCRPDLTLEGPAPIPFQRYYGSMLAAQGASLGTWPNWLGSYDWHLSVAGANAQVITNTGADFEFQQLPGGSWATLRPTDRKITFDSISGFWRLTLQSQRRVYFFSSSTLQLSQILDDHGNSLNLTYGGALLTQVSDGLGRSLTFLYGSGGLLSA